MSKEGSIDSRRGEMKEQAIEFKSVGLRIEMKTRGIGRMGSTRQNNSIERNQRIILRY